MKDRNDTLIDKFFKIKGMDPIASKFIKALVQVEHDNRNAINNSELLGLLKDNLKILLQTTSQQIQRSPHITPYDKRNAEKLCKEILLSRPLYLLSLANHRKQSSEPLPVEPVADSNKGRERSLETTVKYRVEMSGIKKSATSPDDQPVDAPSKKTPGA